MGAMVTLLVMLSASWFSFAVSVEAKNLYLCEEGNTVLLTDRASLGCPVYEPQSEMIRVPDGATWADVEWAVATSRPEAFQSRREIAPTIRSEGFPPQADRGSITPPEAARKDFCEQWIELNLETDGAIDMGDTDNTQKWLALARIVTASNLCEEYPKR